MKNFQISLKYVPAVPGDNKSIGFSMWMSVHRPELIKIPFISPHSIPLYNKKQLDTYQRKIIVCIHFKTLGVWACNEFSWKISKSSGHERPLTGLYHITAVLFIDICCNTCVVLWTIWNNELTGSSFFFGKEKPANFLFIIPLRHHDYWDSGITNAEMSQVYHQRQHCSNQKTFHLTLIYSPLIRR